MQHNDIDFNIPIKLMGTKLKWQDVQKSILKAVREWGLQHKAKIRAERSTEGS
nr:hypothetical protein [uncultured Pedobacter sp.]